VPCWETLTLSKACLLALCSNTLPVVPT
jgi:hypothetical protein